MNKQKLNFLFMFCFIFIFNACTNINKNINWRNTENKNFLFNLQVGDIIIKEKTFSLIGMFGHCGIMKDKYNLIDYPKIGERAYKISLNSWIEKDRDILILRYKNMNDTFKKKLKENLKKYGGKKYKIVFDKKNSDAFYCSQFIWFVYYITAKELGFNLDIDSDKGIIVFPYDLINSKELIILK